jgi:copper chaperone NosL
MSKTSRVLMVVAALALSLVFIFPIWSIDLWAPQYPEGLGLQIWLNKMTGDLDNINLLNHYIGMHRIEPDSIPELKIFVYFFSFLVAFSLLVAAVGKRFLLYIYTVLLLVFSLGAATSKLKATKKEKK